jgi:ABC-type bacteriocin/lantibiotic exporter with double-glycine peptidase domain
LINKGDFIGIKGSSGSGKSTLIDLLVGLNEPDKGNFLIDGKSKILNNPNWRKQIGYVSQNVVLIDDSILQNIALGKDLNKINFENINDVIVKAGLKEFIGTLNEGFNTIVGERGVQLSGGQRQRIGIARALFQNPKILLLDEATSSLDNETEKKIMNSITLLKGQLTIILVAHRLSTLNNCNSIYEIKDHKLKKVS